MLMFSISASSSRAEVVSWTFRFKIYSHFEGPMLLVVIRAVFHEGPLFMLLWFHSYT